MRTVKRMPFEKYRAFAPVVLPERRWPERVIEKAPVWCSVDLRDGNQALIDPMGLECKLRMFEALIGMGFKEIEVGFPSASQTDFDFVREIIERDLIPDDVTIQVLTQSREPLIGRTFEAIKGAKRAIVHLYNSTSALQRRVVFGKDRAGITEIAVRGTRMIKELCATVPDTEIQFEYSPESFSDTELDFAVQICEAVTAQWQPTTQNKIILNLPATVEMATPNVYADQIEWFGRRVRQRDKIVLSVHPHNDRGTAVAAAELAIMAGAERVEGSLFGNGERTGNVDIVTLALNMYTQGINTGLDLSDINGLVRVSEHCTRLPVHHRHPYAGQLVFTAFSGSHQDAIQKGLIAREDWIERRWEVPYLPIDPKDVGRTYEAIIRINSQSGKGGVAYIMEHDYGLKLPRRLQIEFGRKVQQVTDATGCELCSQAIWDIFNKEYLSNGGRFEVIDHKLMADGVEGEIRKLILKIKDRGKLQTISGYGNGPIDAFVDALNREYGVYICVIDYYEHAVERGADAVAMAYVEVKPENGEALFGAGRHTSIVTASLHALASAVNRSGA